MRAFPATWVLLSASLSLMGCGGGGDASSAITLAILSTPGLDGQVTTEPSIESGSANMAAGDSSGGLTARLFVSFPLAGIPNGAAIQSATLELVQNSVSGTPYTDLGVLVLDHLDYGATLDQADFSLGALAPAFGVLSGSPVLGLRTLDVKTQVEADIAALRTRSQFRGLFGAPTDGNADDDYVNFATNEAASGKPVLVVVYLP